MHLFYDINILPNRQADRACMSKIAHSADKPQLHGRSIEARSGGDMSEFSEAAEL